MVQSLEASHPAWLPAAAPGTAEVPFPALASHGGARSAQPRQLGDRDAPRTRPPHVPPPAAGRGARGVRRPDAGCGSPSPSVRVSILLAGPPLPQRNGAGAGGRRQAGLGGRSWLEPLRGDPRPAAGLGPGRLPAQRSPGGVIFGRGWDARPGGRAPINVPLSPLFGGRQQLGARTPAPISMETLPRPWETLLSLSFPPRKRGGREGEETSGSPLPDRGRRHDAREMGTAGGASGSANVPAAQLPAPAGLCCGVPPAPWGSLPFPGRAGTQPSALSAAVPRGKQLAVPAAAAWERKDPQQPLAAAPPPSPPPNRVHRCARRQLGGG